MIKCPLCGNEFDEEKSTAGCAGCGKSGCGLVRCPNCFYEFPPDSTLKKEGEKKSGFLKKLIGGK